MGGGYGATGGVGTGTTTGPGGTSTDENAPWPKASYSARYRSSAALHDETPASDGRGGVMVTSAVGDRASGGRGVGLEAMLNVCA